MYTLHLEKEVFTFILILFFWVIDSMISKVFVSKVAEGHKLFWGVHQVSIDSPVFSNQFPLGVRLRLHHMLSNSKHQRWDCCPVNIRSDIFIGSLVWVE